MQSVRLRHLNLESLYHLAACNRVVVPLLLSLHRGIRCGGVGDLESEMSTDCGKFADERAERSESESEFV
jgi:hypothetical protein